MGKAARDWAYTADIRAPAKPVLVALSEHADDSGRCWPSLSRLADMTGYDVRTVRRAVRALEKCRLISVEHRPGQSPVFGLKLSTTPDRVTDQTESPPGQSDRGPRSESPGGAVRESGDPGQSDRLTVKNSKGTEREPKKRGIELPGWMPGQTWADFVEHRKKLKSAMTDIAQKRAVKKLAAMREEGQDIEAVIEQSIINGWKGLFPVKQDKGGDRFSRSVDALNSIFGEENESRDIQGRNGVHGGGLLEGAEHADFSSVLGPARRASRR